MLSYMTVSTHTGRCNQMAHPCNDSDSVDDHLIKFSQYAIENSELLER